MKQRTFKALKVQGDDPLPTLVDVQGYEVKFVGFKGIDFFAYNAGDKRTPIWFVCEVSTGTAVSMGADTRKEALVYTEHRLNLCGFEKFKRILSEYKRFRQEASS